MRGVAAYREGVEVKARLFIICGAILAISLSLGGQTNTSAFLTPLFGLGAPSSGACTSTNLGQLYYATATMPFPRYICLPGGWTLQGNAQFPLSILGVPVPLGFTDAFQVTGVPPGPVNVSSQQSILSGPLVFDHFIHTDSTALNGLTAESGNSTWSVGGSGGSTIASISGTRLINNVAASLGYGFYASLGNSSTIGGALQPVTEVGVVYYLCPSTAGTYNPGQQGGALMANDAVGDIQNMLHVTFGPEGWVLTKFVGGVTTPLLTNIYPAEPPDCITPRQMVMRINTAAGTVMVVDPTGASQSATDSDITNTIKPVSGTWEIVSATNYVTTQIGEVWMGKSLAEKYASQGLSATSSDVGALQGTWGTSRYVYPSITIPNAAGGGGTGWYRIASGATQLGSEDLIGTFIISAYVPGTGGQVLTFRAASPLGAGYSNTVVLDNELTGATPIDQVRVSNDGSANVGLDIHLNATYTTSAITINMLGVGILTPATAFPVGATAYTNSTVLSTTTTGYGFALIPITGRTNGADGGTAQAAGACTYDFVPMNGTITSGMAFTINPEADPGPATYYKAFYYSSADAIIYWCSAIAATPNPVFYRVTASLP
jgi:hypothetical protein